MQRFTISIEDDLADQCTQWIESQHYSSRSEAFRDLLRARLAEQTLQNPSEAECVASVTYLYDHHERELSRRLTQYQHEHHELTVSTMHVHLDTTLCLEVAVMRGPVAAVSKEAQILVAERGVEHGNVHLVLLPQDAPRPTWHRH